MCTYVYIYNELNAKNGVQDHLNELGEQIRSLYTQNFHSQNLQHDCSFVMFVHVTIYCNNTSDLFYCCHNKKLHL
jgi:hypothetical protein